LCYVRWGPARDRRGCRRGANLPDYLRAIDQGRASTRAIVFDAARTPVASAQQEFAQLYPAPGLVEHNPEDIWLTTLATVRTTIARAGVEARQIAALGIANQRETTIVWERATGRPIHNAIVWQDLRTADPCAALQARGEVGCRAMRIVRCPTGLAGADPRLRGGLRKHRSVR